MPKEKFNASKITIKDLELIDTAVAYYYGQHICDDEQILLLKRKIEWLLTYGGIK